jgi:WD40 repeat protein
MEYQLEIKVIQLTDPVSAAIVLQPGSTVGGADHFLAWDSHGLRLASGKSNGSAIQIWDPRTSGMVQEGPVRNLRSLGWNPDQSALLATSASGDLHKLDIRLGTMETHEALPATARGKPMSAFSSDGKWLAYGNSDGISLVNASTRETLSSTGIPACLAVRWSTDDSLVAIDKWGEVHIWDPFANQVVAVAKKPDRGYDISWRPDNRLLAVASQNGEIQIIRASDSETVARLRGHRGEARGVDWARHGRIASAGADGTVRIWDAAIGHELAAFEHPYRMAFLSVRWSPDGRRLAAGDSEGRVFIWGSNDIPYLPPGRRGLETGAIQRAAVGR